MAVSIPTINNPPEAGIAVFASAVAGVVMQILTARYGADLFSGQQANLQTIAVFIAYLHWGKGAA